MLEAIGRAVPRASWPTMRKLVPFEQELELCRSYVDIEQLRLGERLHVTGRSAPMHPKVRCRSCCCSRSSRTRSATAPSASRGAARSSCARASTASSSRSSSATRSRAEPLATRGQPDGAVNIRGRLALIYDLEAQLETRARRDRFELTLTLPVRPVTHAQGPDRRRRTSSARRAWCSCSPSARDPAARDRRPGRRAASPRSRRLSASKPDVVLLDITMPGMNGSRSRVTSRRDRAAGGRLRHRLRRARACKPSRCRPSTTC